MTSKGGRLRDRADTSDRSDRPETPVFGREPPRKALGWLGYAALALALVLGASLPPAFAQSVTLTTSDITITTVKLTITGHSGSWYWKATRVDTNTAGDCSGEVTGTETTATGLTTSVQYQFTAYSDVGCSSQLAQSGVVQMDGFALDPPQGFANEGPDTTLSIRVTVPTSGISENLTATLTTDDTSNSKVTLSQTTASFIPKGTRTVNVIATIHQDDDGKTDVVHVTGTVTAGQSDLLGKTGTSKITIYDDDADFTLSETKVALTEGGGSGTYTLKLAADPVDDVTVTVTSSDPGAVTVDTDGTTTGDQSEVAFTGGSTGNWSTARTITLTPVDDADENDESVTITHATSAADYPAANKTLTATVEDDEPERLEASSVEDDSATLTLTNHTGDWYYKYTVPSSPAGTCSTVVSTGTYTASLTGLTSGTSYTYKAYSDTQCNTELTSAATDAEFLTKPGQATGVGATAGTNSLTVSWTAPSGTVTGYKVQWKKGSDNYDAARTSTITDGSTTSTTITGLTSDQHTVRVTAYNATGDGDHSSEATGTPNAGVTLVTTSVEDDTATLSLAHYTGVWYYKYTVPSSPAGTCSTAISGVYTADLTGLTPATSYTFKAYSDTQCNTEVTIDATDAEFLTKPGQVTGVGAASGDTSLTVGWTALSGTVTGYKVQWKKVDQSYTSERTNTVTGGASTSSTITGLTNETQYTVRVTAYNATGDGDHSSEATGRPAVPPPTLTASDVEDDTATLTLTHRTGAWYYKYTVPSSPAGTCTAAGSGVYTASLTGLTPATSYTYKAYADAQCGALLEFTTDATDADFVTKPGQVTGVGATSGDASLTVGWTALSGTVTGYKVQWKTGSDNYTAARTNTVTGGTSTSNTITGLTNNTQYTVRVTAYNATGDGDASSEATGTPVAPPTLAADLVDDDTARLTLTHHTGNWYYKYTAPSLPAGTCSTVVSTGTYTVNLASLLTGTSYTFKAYSDVQCNTELTSDATDAEFLTKPGKAAGVAAAGGAGAGTLDVGWTATTGATGYRVQWKTSAQQWDATGRQTTSTTTSKTITGLTSGTQYTVRVKAGNTTGYSPSWSDTATGTASTEGVTLSTTGLTAREGGSATYTVVLDTRPSHAVTIAVANRGQSNTDDSDLTVSPASLVFSAANWSTPQTVTVTAGQDSDTTDGSAVITHTATSTDSDYGASLTIASVTATEDDDDAHGVLVSKTALSVPEEGSASYTIRLATVPSATVLIDISKQAGGDGDLTFSPAQLTFPTTGWDLPQTVTVFAAEDADAARGTATLTHTATSADTSYGGVTIASVTATEDDDELGVTVSETAVSVPEGGSATWTVVLDGPPAANVTIAVAKKTGGDGNLTVSPASLTFTTTNWSSAQTVTASAAQDNDETDGTATFTHTAASTDAGFNGLAVASVTATEDDDDTPGVTLSATSVSVTEGSTATYTVVLDTAPTQNVTIAVARQSGGDTNLTAAPASLTFTTTNWSSTQTVTVSAAEDDTDDTDGTATFTHTAASTDTDYGASLVIASVTATEDDNDTFAGVTVSKTSLTVAEGGSATYTVALDTAPSADVTIAVANRGQSADDSDLTVSPASLTFTTTSWSSAQTVTVSAADDADDADGTAVVTHTATSTDNDYSGITIADVTATEDDDETPGAAPTSADFTLAVSRDNRTAIPLSRFPFSDEDSADTLRGVKVVTLPSASHGTLGLVKTGVYAQTTVLCVGTITPLIAGQEVPNTPSTVMYFCPGEGFKSTTFGFQVVDSQGRASETSYTATLTGPPGQITGLQAEAGTGYVRLSWTDPKNPAITGYEHRQRSGAGVTTWGAWTAMTGSDATTTSWSITGLTNATAYSFQVRAKSAGGPGPIPSAAVTATPVSGVPAKPTGLQVLNLGDDVDDGNTFVEVALFWDDPGDPSIIRYEVEQNYQNTTWQRPINAGWQGNNNHVPNSGPTTTSVEFDVGSHESKYTFRVRAVNAAGNGAWGETERDPDLGNNSIELDADGGVPVLESAEPGNTRLRLRWTHRGPTLSHDGGFWSFWSATSTTPTFTTLGSGSVKADARSYVVTGLKNNNTYTVQIHSWGKRYADDPSARVPLYSNTRTVTLPAAPAKPAGLAAKATPGGAALSWTDPKNGAITGWEYQHKAGSNSYGSWTRVPGSRAGTTSASVPRLANGITHKFKVRAVIEYETALGGTLAGAASDEASVVPVAVVVSKDRLDLTEGGAAGEYTVKLRNLPTSNVTITVSVDADGTVTADTDDVTSGNQNTLTFTTSNWNSAQTVKVTAAEDDDGRDSTTTITHTASSTDARYANLTALPGVTVAVDDNDVLGIVLSKSNVPVTEGATATYTVTLGAKPTGGGVTVTIARDSGGDADLTIADTDPGATGTQNTLAFTTGNWSSAQTVTVSAAEDDNDVVDGAATFTHTAAGGGYGAAIATLTATSADNDDGIVLSESSLSVREGGSATYTVKLGTQPGAAVTVTIDRASGGDSDLTVDTAPAAGSQNTLTFTTSNYATTQTVTVSAAQDADEDNDTATFTHTASGAGSGYAGATESLTATESDDEGANISLSASTVTLTEGGSTGTYTVALSKAPNANVTVAVSSDDTGAVTVSPAALTFTTTSYSTGQTVTLTPVHDADGIDESVTVSHAASGGGYANVNADVTATVADDDQGLTVTGAPVSLTEGGATGSYTVRLSTLPSAAVTVAVSSGDTGAVTVNKSSLTFTTSNWSSTQTVTLSAVDDTDGADESVTVSNTSSDTHYDTTINVTATVDDDDQGITLSASTVTLTEGGSTGTYTVKLDAAPNANVTVAVSSDDTDAVTASPSSLTFTTSNYSSVQTVTLTAVQDADGAHESVTVSNTSSGGGYDASADVTVTVNDDDRRITLSPSTVALTEGSTGTYTVSLSAVPDGNVTVAVSSGDPGAVTVNKSSLTFTTTNYSSAQTVTLTAEEDGDGIDESVTVTHSASGGGYGASADVAVSVSVDDDDRGLTLSAASVALTEGGSTGSYTVKLAGAPNANVTVTVSSGDTDAVTASPAMLTFTTTNYASVQTVTLTAVNDDDGADESVTVRNSASGGGYDTSDDETVSVSVDDDEQGLTLSASSVALTEGGSTDSYTVKLAAAPNANVTVAVSSDDTGAVTASPSTLTFTTSNYSSVQTVTLTAVEDGDGTDESVTVSNAASGGGYTVSADVTATVDDDDQGLELSVSNVALTEGGSTGSYTVALSSAPNANVTVAVSSGDTGAVTASPAKLTFTTTNYSTAQTVTLTPVGDADGADESVTVSNAASGGGYAVSAGVTATVDDDEQGLTLSKSDVALTEDGSTGSYTVKLNAAPNANVTVAVSSPDTGAVTASPASLTFTTSNYASVQTVTLTPVDDTDGADESVTVTNTSSGGGYDASAPVTATVDDDEQGLTLSKSTVPLTEGGSTDSYTVKLNAAPNANVTVAVASDDTGAVTVSPASLTFTTTNYSTVQTVTLTPVDDDDGADESVTVSHTASGGGYQGASAKATAAVTVDDNDQGLTLSKSDVALTEGGSKDSYTVKLNAAPNGNVTVAVSSPDTGAVTASPASLTFTTTNYSTVQTVTLEPVGDADGADESVTVSNSASGGGYAASAGVTATVDDDDQGLDLSASSVALTEGGSTGSYTVKLAAAPNGNVTVAVSSPDTGAVTASPASLTFTTSDYSTAQTVTLTVVNDDDGADESVTVTNTSSGGGYNASGEVTATVDDDEQGLTLSASSVALTEGGSTDSYTVKLAAAPSANVTVAVSSGDTGAVTASPASLTFTTSNYSTVQTVTLTVVNDADGADESVKVSNAASGGGYDASGDVTATVDDDDQGLTLSKSSVTVTEGGTETYTVVLDAQPAGPVTVTIAKANGDDADLTVDRSTLTFTTGNWSSAHTVTVRAAEESGNDYTHGTATFTHTASGGGYATTAALTAKEADNDRVVGVPATLRVPEGATATYDVKLAEQPNANVTLTLAKSGDTDLTVDTDGTTDGDQNTLTFTNSNWSTAQTVTVAAAQDGDFANGSADISHTAASSDTSYDGIPIPTVRATEADDDTPPPSLVAGLDLSSSNVTVPEGATATYTVVLATQPAADVTVTLARAPGGDPDLAVDTDPTTPGAQSTLVFTPARWNVAQTVTVTAAPDADELDGTATFTHTASGGGYDDVSATLVAVEADDNRRLVLSTSRLTVPEGGVATYTVALAAQPGGDVTVTLARNPGGDPDLAVDTDPGTPGAQDTLVFTPADWRTARTVTVAAAADADGLDGTATFTHTAAGGGYGGMSATLAATEADDDRAIVLSASRLTVPEGLTATYTVALGAQPDAPVTVTLTRDADGDADLAVDTDPDTAGAQGALVFTPADFSDARTVTVAAAVDADDLDGAATFTHTAAGGAWTGVSATLVVTEEDEPAPVAVGTLPALTLAAGGEPRTVDVSGAFRGASLVYAVRSSHEDVVAASIEGAVVTLTALRGGEARITVTARNRIGEARQSFTAAVGAEPAEKRAVRDGLAAIGRGMLSGMDTTLGARLRGESSEGVKLAGRALGSGGAGAAPGGARGLPSGGAQGLSHGGAQGLSHGGAQGLSHGAGQGFSYSAGQGLPNSAAQGLSNSAAQGLPNGAAQGLPNGAAQGFSHGAGRAFPGLEREAEIADLDWLGGTSFVVPLSADADAGAGGGIGGGLSRWTFWGQGDLQSFDSGRSSIDGETRTAWLGLDAEWGDDWLLGAAVSYGEGRADYTVEGGDGSGELRTTLTSVHPYLRWRPWNDGTVWAAVGAGDGRIENRRDRLGRVERGDLSMLAALGGGRYALLPAAGGVELALLGDLAFLRMRTEADAAQGTLDGVSSSVGRLRVGFEGAYEISMDPGALSPFAQVSARYDGGDGETGSGMELSGGVRYHHGRMSFETGGRMLWAAGDYEESGWSLALSLEPRADRRGLSLSLSPTWGTAQHRALEALWRPDALSGLDDGAAPADAGHGMRTSIGYGLRWPASTALLTPYAEHDRFSSGDRRTSMGLRLEHRPSRLEVDLRGELEETPGGEAGDAGVFLKLGVRF